MTPDFILFSIIFSSNWTWVSRINMQFPWNHIYWHMTLHYMTLPLLESWFNDILNTCHYPDKSVQGTMTLIHKNGSKWCAENYGRVSVMPALGYPAQSGQTVRLPVWPWQQVCVWCRYEKEGVRATWIFIMTSPVYWLWYGGHTQVRLSGLQELGREEGGSELIAHIRDIKESAVADNWIDEDGPR